MENFLILLIPISDIAQSTFQMLLGLMPNASFSVLVAALCQLLVHSEI